MPVSARGHSAEEWRAFLAEIRAGYARPYLDHARDDPAEARSISLAAGAFIRGHIVPSIRDETGLWNSALRDERERRRPKQLKLDIE